MTIKITWPRDVAFDYAWLRAHADWFKRQVARDPRYGASRFARAARAREARTLPHPGADARAASG